MQGFLTIQNTDPTEVSLYMGNRERVPVEAIGTYHLFLDTGYHLDLLNCLFVPTIVRNLISISKLDIDGFIVSLDKILSIYLSHLLLLDLG